MMSRNDEFDETQIPYGKLVPGDREPRFGPDDDDFSPFASIWTRPRDTVRRIVATNPDLHVVLLICLGGIVESLNRASTRNLGDSMPMAWIIVVACTFGPLGGLVSLWISSHLIQTTGSWMGGVGNRRHIKTAIAWGSVPAVLAGSLWIPQLLMFGSEMFTEETPRLAANPMLLYSLFAMSLAEIVLGIWALVLLCNTITEVQGFRSAWAGFGNLLLTSLVLVVAVLVVVFMAAMLTRV